MAKRKSQSNLLDYAANYAIRYITRAVVRPLINKFLPTWIHKAVAFSVLLAASYFYPIYSGYL